MTQLKGTAGRLFLSTMAIVVFICLVSCGSDFRPRAEGSAEEVLIVMDSLMFSSETASALRNTFGREITTIPQTMRNGAETLFQLKFMTISNNDELEGIKRQRNVVFAGLIDRSEKHTSELQSRSHLVCRHLLEKTKQKMDSI